MTKTENFTSATTGTANDVQPGISGVVSTQGDAEDFTWEFQYSLDGGTTWTAMEDSAGNTSFTGSLSKQILAAPGPKVRVEITALGTATDINTNISLHG